MTARSCGKHSRPRDARRTALTTRTDTRRRRRPPMASASTHRLAARGLLALDMNGKQVWFRDLGPMDDYHGTAGSPLLYKDRLILYQDQSRQLVHRRVRHANRQDAVDTRRAKRASAGARRSPSASSITTRSSSTDSSRVQAYNPDTGAELWSCGGTTYEVIPTPVVGYGMVFCSSGRAGPTLAIRPGGQGDVTRSHLAWTSPRGSPFVPSPILYGEHLYMVNDMQSIVTSFEATTGKADVAGPAGRRAGGKASRRRRSPWTARCSSPTTRARRSC